MLNYRSVDDMNQLIKSKLHLILDVDVIIGVPRSGMLPATLIALYLGKPLISVEQIGSDSNKFTSRIPLDDMQIKKALVVDDSIFSGNAMNKVREFLSGVKGIKFIYCAVYATYGSKDKVDFYFDIVEQWRMWEWNIMDHLVLESSCVDMDGVLCVDPTPEQNDDGKEYLKFIKNTAPRFIPKHKIKAIVTCRLEKYRKETERWLNDHGVQYGSLYMMDLPDKATRQRLGNYAQHKAKIYTDLNASLFIESNPSEAGNIALITGKPVYCLGDNRWYKERI